MAGELNITVVGNLANDPELRNTNSGIAFVGLNVASTPRTYNRNTSTWEDGETVWVRCTAWREVAENVARSLTKGTRVIVTGRLKPASAYQAANGESRASIELEIEEIELGSFAGFAAPGLLFAPQFFPYCIWTKVSTSGEIA